MSLPKLFDRCVYTIVKLSDLEDRFLDGANSFEEGKPWKSVREWLVDAKSRGESIPIFFSNADRVGSLYFWALLTDITIQDTNPRTTFKIDQLRRFVGPTSPDDCGIPTSELLHVESTGKPLSRKQIRPYTLCHTPDPDSELLQLMEQHCVTLDDEKRLVEKEIRFCGCLSQDGDWLKLDRVIWNDDGIELEWHQSDSEPESRSPRVIRAKLIAEPVTDDKYEGTCFWPDTPVTNGRRNQRSFQLRECGSV